jgi:hypothetical protein
MTEAMMQVVEVPLWMLILFLAYSERRVADIVGGLKRLTPGRREPTSGSGEGDSSG